MAVFRSKPVLNKLVWALATLVLLVGAYALAGFYLVPHLVRTQGTQWVKDNLHKTLSLGEIRFNPFTFEADIDGIALPDRPSAHKAAPMVAIGHFHLAFSVRSLFGPAYRLRELRIDRPEVNAVLRPDGTLNLADLVPPASPDSKGPAPAFRIDRLTINQGRAGFVDLGLANHPEQVLAPLTFTLNDFETARGRGRLHAPCTQRQRRGTGLEGHGLARPARLARHAGDHPVASPYGAGLPRWLSAAHAQGWRGQFPGAYALTYAKGAVRLSAQVPDVTFEKIAFAGKPTLFNGLVTIDRARTAIPALEYRSANPGGAMGFQATVPGLNLSGIGIAPPSGSPIRLPEVDVADARFDYAAHSLQVGSLTIDRPSLALRREASGAIDLMRMMPRASAPADPQAPAWNVELGSARVSQARIGFEDRTVSPAARYEVAPATLTASTLGTDLARPITLAFNARSLGAGKGAGGQHRGRGGLCLQAGRWTWRSSWAT
jgi:hypothetical protein